MDMEISISEPRDGADNPCMMCGRDVGEAKFFVHLLTTGSISDQESHDDSQGFFPIGSGCAKKLPHQFVFRI